MASSQIRNSLPAIKAAIGHIPQHLRTEKIAIERGRLHILRRMVTRLIREERCEFTYNRAMEARQYMERLLQLGVYYGREDSYTKEMTDWWIAEEDLRQKFFDVLVPRFKAHEEPYTALYKLPKECFISFVRKKHIKRRVAELGVLELKGNPYPPVVSRPVDYSSFLCNILVRNAVQKRLEFDSSKQK